MGDSDQAASLLRGCLQLPANPTRALEPCLLVCAPQRLDSPAAAQPVLVGQEAALPPGDLNRHFCSPGQEPGVGRAWALTLSPSSPGGPGGPEGPGSP